MGLQSVVESVLDVAGVAVSLRVTGRRRAPSGRVDTGPVGEAVPAAGGNVIIEVRGIRPNDKIRSRVLISSIKKAVEELAGEKPVCIPPSAASGLISCSFRASYKDFNEFAGRLVDNIASNVYESIDALGYVDRMRVGGLKKRVLLVVLAAAAIIALALYSLLA